MQLFLLYNELNEALDPHLWPNLLYSSTSKKLMRSTRWQVDATSQ